jgi:hypothetical protein
MYDTKFECRYHKEDVFLETDNVNDNEKCFIRDILYKEDLLNIFSIDHFDNNFDIFSNVISELYSKIKHCLPLNECIKKWRQKLCQKTYKLDYVYYILTIICV